MPKINVLLAGGHSLDLHVDEDKVQAVRNDLTSDRPGTVRINFPDTWVDIVRAHVVAVTPAKR